MKAVPCPSLVALENRRVKHNERIIRVIFNNIYALLKKQAVEFHLFFAKHQCQITAHIDDLQKTK